MQRHKDSSLSACKRNRSKQRTFQTATSVNKPRRSLETRGDGLGPVGDYRSLHAVMGTNDEVRIYHGTLTAEEIQSLGDPAAKPTGATLVLSCSFDKGDAADASGNKNHGKPDGVRKTDGKFGTAMRFRGNSNAPQGAGSFVQHNWTVDVPLLVRAMVKADDKLFIADPPDLIDEEEHDLWMLWRLPD